MKIIDLLNKIANGEEVPKEIKYRDWLYEFEKDCNDYMCQYDSLLYRENDDVRQFLNDEVEIIEEEKKIPEKLSTWFSLEKDCENNNIQYANNNFKTMYEKINEIIDCLKSKGE